MSSYWKRVMAVCLVLLLWYALAMGVSETGAETERRFIMICLIFLIIQQLTNE